MFKYKTVTAFDVTNYLYPVGKPEFDPILTDDYVREFRSFRIAQKAEWRRDRPRRRAEVETAKEMFAAYRRAAVDKGWRV